MPNGGQHRSRTRAALHVLWGALSIALPHSASAQSAPERCELHVWPSDGMNSVRQRASESRVAGGALEGIIKRTEEAGAERADARARGELAGSEVPEPMATSTQIELLKSLPLAEMMGLPNHRVVIHDTALDSRKIRTVKTRYIETAAPCYADLVVDDVTYSRAYANGQALKTFFRFRDFGTAAAAVRSFGTWVDTKLRIFSLDPLNVSPAALEEVATAYRTNVTLFADLLRKRP